VRQPGRGLACAFGAATLSALVGGACSPFSDSDVDTLVITGSSTIAPVVAEVAQQYEREHPNVRIDVQSGGSSRGIGDVRSGLADIGMVSRPLEGEEQKLRAHAIARDGVGIILNARNPVVALDEAQVAAIYRGEIQSWANVGGRDAPIVVVHKAEGRATLEVFLEHFGLDNREVDADVIVGENEQAIKTVAGSPDAIGYVSIGTAAVDIEYGVAIRLLGVGSVTATLENLRRGVYPIARPLNLVTREPAEGLAKAFIDYVRSPAATALIEGQHFVQVGG
jgi:phosphate transport system substrate-binding protein